MSLWQDHDGEVRGGLYELEGRSVHCHLARVLATLPPAHRLQDQQVLPVPDHLGALQVYLDVVRVEHHPLQLPPGARHISVDLGLVQEPLKCYQSTGDTWGRPPHLQTVEVVVAGRQGEVAVHVNCLPEDGVLGQPHSDLPCNITTSALTGRLRLSTLALISHNIHAVTGSDHSLYSIVLCHITAVSLQKIKFSLLPNFKSNFD